MVRSFRSHTGPGRSQYWSALRVSSAYFAPLRADGLGGDVTDPRTRTAPGHGAKIPISPKPRFDATRRSV